MSRSATIAAVAAATVLVALVPAASAETVPLGQYGVGTAGGGAGELDTPSGLALDGAGNVYVADYNNHRISVFGPGGGFLRAFGFDVVPAGSAGLEVCTTSCKPGVAGGDAGQLSHPGSVALDEAGNVFVADTDNHRIAVFSAAGEFVRAFGWDVIPDVPDGPEVCTTSCQAGVAGGEAGQFTFPTGLALHPDGPLLVADYSNNRLSEYTRAGEFVRTSGFDVISQDPVEFEICTASCKAGIAGGAPGQLSFPHDVAIDPAGEVSVADYFNHRVSVFGALGQFRRSFGFDVIPGGPAGFERCTTDCQAGVPGGAPGQLDLPVGVGSDPAGNLYVADSANQRISIFETEFLRAFGFDVVPGGGPPGFEVCTTTCDSGDVGEAVGQMNQPYDVAFDCAGAIYVVEVGNHRVQRFGEPGTVLPPCSEPPPPPPRSSPPPPPTVLPSNEFSFGKLKRNKRRGAAKLPVIVPGPGELELAAKKGKPTHASVPAGGAVKLPVRAKGKPKRKLIRTGSLKLTLAVTYEPTGGTPKTKPINVKLKRRQRAAPCAGSGGASMLDRSHRSPQGRLHVRALVSNLLMRESKRCETGGRVRLIAKPIPGLLGRRAVVAEPIGLDDEAQLRPVEVDEVPVETLARPWNR